MKPTPTPPTFGIAATGRMSPLKKITVLMADDSTAVRQGLCALLKTDGHFKVVGQARNGLEAVNMTRALRPDIILMDISMPVLSGLEATRQILTLNPAAKVLILSAHSDDAYIESMTAVGAAGFLEKQNAAHILTKAIHEVVNGRRFFSPAIATRMTNGKNWSRNHDGLLKPKGVRLTSGETKVLRLVAEGQENKQVAKSLGLSLKAVEKHRKLARDKFNQHESADLTHYAIAQGLINKKRMVKVCLSA